MPIGRMSRGDVASPSRGVNILNKVLSLVEDNQNTDEFLKLVDLSGCITDHMPADVSEHTLYVGIETIPTSLPQNLGRHSVTYLDTYVVSIFYYDTTIDKGDNLQYLTLVMDMLNDFFAKHSDLGGLCNMGIITVNPRITHVPHGEYFYNAVAMELVARVVKTKHRHPTP
jgi:hypothetical protein